LAAAIDAACGFGSTLSKNNFAAAGATRFG